MPNETLNVLVDAVSARRGGGATFLFEQLRSLEKIADIRLTVITTDAARAAVGAHCAHSAVTSWPVRPLPLRILREQATLPRRATGYDVVYMPGNFALARNVTPQVLVVQSPWHFGQEGRLARRRWSKPMQMRLAVESAAARASVRNAERVICVSEAMRSYVVEDFGDLDKIAVAPSAPPRFPPGLRQSDPHDPYVLSVGIDLPHKDWTGLISAFEHETDLPPLWLVGWCSQARRHELAERSRNSPIRMLGPVTDRSELADLYRNATCTIAHSHLESYGFTGVEALSVGSPLAASDIPAHREFCGSAAHYYDPRDHSALATAVREAISAGPATASAPAQAFTWEGNAEMTGDMLRRAAIAGRRG
jgi:glycosyltransferase involved in cell wall biosynthesis